MKKGREKNEKKKGFSNVPFKGLKSFDVRSEGPPEEPLAAKTAPPPPARPDEDDSALFLREMEGIKRLHGEKPRKVQAPKPPVESEPGVNEAERKLFLSALSGMDVSFRDEIPDVKPLRPVAVNRMRQLKSGAIRVDLELDLHGQTRDEALKSLERFIAGAYNRGQKAVLVITGRGNNSPAEPVLLLAVAAWLREAGRKMVSEFAPAPPRLGGAGAFVVFLKGKKGDGGDTGQREETRR